MSQVHCYFNVEEGVYICGAPFYNKEHHYAEDECTSFDHRENIDHHFWDDPEAQSLCRFAKKHEECYKCLNVAAQLRSLGGK